MTERKQTIAEKFMEAALDANRWFSRSHYLKESADNLHKACERYIMQSIPSPIRIGPPPSVEERGRASMSGLNAIMTSFLLYGLAIELALKGRIISHQPDKAKFNLSIDGKGRVIDASSDLKSHNLEALANDAGLLEKGGDNETRVQLRLLSEYVKWRARYPIPNKSDNFETDDVERGTSKWGQMKNFVESFLERVHPDLFRQDTEHPDEGDEGKVSKK